LGIDTYGSVLQNHETGIFDEMKSIPILKGMGEDILPKMWILATSMVTKVTDKRCSSLHKKNYSWRRYFFFGGNSTGSCVKKKDLHQLRTFYQKMMSLLFYFTIQVVMLEKCSTTIGCANRFLDEEVTKAEDVIKDHIGKTLI
jgi:cystathionine beta-synthase